MKRSAIETVLGALVLLVAGCFMIFSYKTANVSTSSGGYNIVADFSTIGGLKSGDAVQISGVRVGQVVKVALNPDTYLARVTMAIDQDIKLPEDTAALISSESLLGGRYLALEPGASEDILPAGGRVEFTQSPQNLEQLLGQFIFSMSDSKKESDNKVNETANDAAAPERAVPAERPEPATEETDAYPDIP